MAVKLAPMGTPATLIAMRWSAIETVLDPKERPKERELVALLSEMLDFQRLLVLVELVEYRAARTPDSGTS
jgi:hypothetical protein